MAKQKPHRPPGDGAIRKLPSGNYQARFTFPDGVMKPADTTFGSKALAQAWLARQRVEVEDGTWAKKRQSVLISMTFEDYSRRWLDRRKVDGRPLADRTQDGYRDLLKRFIYPEFATKPLHVITREDVDRWYDRTATTTPTYRARAYSLFRTILNSAVKDGHLDANPAQVPGGGSAPRTHRTRILEDSELDAITEAIPPRYRALVQLAYWTGLRFGELTELRRKDLDMERRTLHVRRAVVLVDGEFKVKTPKSWAGIRDVRLPKAVMPYLRTHLAEHATEGAEGLLFPSKNDPRGHLRQSALTKVFYPAREAAGRPDFRWHDFRHTHLTNFAQTGATLKEVQRQGGHSSHIAAMRYQEDARDRRADMTDLMEKQSKARRRKAAARAAKTDTN